jgi:hypothetical protein
VDVEVIKKKLQVHDVAFVATREIPGQQGQIAAFFSCQAINNVVFLIELKFKSGMNICKITVRSPNKTLSEICKNAIAALIA